MKVIFYLESTQFGGLDTFSTQILNNWSSTNDKLILVCNSSHPGKNILEKNLNKSIDFVQCDIPLSWSLTAKYLYFLTREIRRLFQPFLRLILYKKQKKVLKYLFKRLECDQLFVINGGFPGGESSRIANIVWFELYRKKSIHNFHNDAIKPHFLFSFFENYIDKQLISSVSHFITVSNSCAKSIYARKYFSNVQVEVIYNGIDLSLFKHQNVEQAIPFSCVFLANYEPRKGHQFLFEALEKVRQTIPQLTLFIYGGHDKEQMNFVKSLHSRYAPNLDVRFNGYNSSISKQLRKFKVLLICSQEFESFGLTAIEAMIQGIPVVSTNVGGLKEVIKVEGNGGFLFNKDDVKGFSKKVIELMEDEELRLDTGRKGIDYVNENFEIKKMVFNYKKFLI